MENLIDKTLSGDENAYAELIMLVKPYLIATAKTKLNNSDDIDDAIQETIIKSYNNLHKLENKKYFKTWIIRILINECNNIIENNSKHTTIFNKSVHTLGNSVYSNNTDKMDDALFMEELFEKLDDDEKEIANLYFKDNLTTEKIAELLHSNRNTVKSKLYRIRLKLKKLAILIILLCIITTTTVFADEIIKFIVSLFTTSRQAIDTAVENDYIQNVDMDFVYDNGIGIKVDYILIDNKDLNVSYVFDCKENTDITSVKLLDYTITDENGNNIYNTDLKCITSILSDFEKIFRIENNIFRYSNLYSAKNYFPISKKLIFNINSVSSTIENTFEKISGKWCFEVDLENKFLNRTSQEYFSSYNEYIKNIDTTIDETSLTIKININILLNKEYIINQILAQNLYLENSLDNQKYDLLYFKSNNDVNNLGYIELKYDISKYYENIDKLHLYLPFNENKVIDIILSK